MDGSKRIKSDPRLFRIIFAKTSWNIAGGGLAGVFLVLAGNDIDFVGAALGFGIFFFARGVGTGIGPILARRLFKDSEKWPRLIGLLIVVSGVFYLFVGLSLNGPLVADACFGYTGTHCEWWELGIIDRPNTTMGRRMKCGDACFFNRYAVALTWTGHIYDICRLSSRK